MISSYFYPGSSGGEPRYKADELGNRLDDQKPRQLSLLDWMLQRTDLQPHIEQADHD
jgi:hypothetical protein